MRNDFAAFILTHGRPHRQLTYKLLKRLGYTGKIYFIVDTDDEKASEYINLYSKESVILFDKAKIAEDFDEGDNFQARKTIFFARNAAFGIAKTLGIKYFIQLDDDYSSFDYKFDQNLIYCDKSVKNLDKIFTALLNFYISADITTLAVAQGGDFMGGALGHWASNLSLKRKAMNTFICSTDRPFKFVGKINEDVNTYVLLGSQGKLILTIPNLMINQGSTQKSAGGMTDIYLDSGTYIKSFYSVMYNPSSVKVAMMGSSHRRLHHRIDWNNTAVKILEEKYASKQHQQNR